MTTTNSIHSPKNKFHGTIYQAGISGSGDCLSLSCNSLEELKVMLEKEANGKPAHIVISENKKEYPRFDWIEIDNYEVK